MLCDWQVAQYARARSIAAVAEIGQYQGTGKKDGCQNGCGAREECCAAAGTEQTAGCAAAEGGTCIGAFALLHEDEADHGKSADNLYDQQNGKQDVHGKSVRALSARMLKGLVVVERIGIKINTAALFLVCLPYYLYCVQLGHLDLL